MMYSCYEKAMELSTKLAEKGYDEEIVTAANDLANKIGEYEDEHPMDAPVMRTMENGKYGNDKMSHDKDKMSHEYDDMNEKDMRKSMKKSGIIISFE